MRSLGIGVRRDITAAVLRKKARGEKDGKVAMRLLGIANILEGMDRESAARTSGMTRQTLRDWVHRYNAEGMAGLSDRPKGRPDRALTPEQEQEVAALVMKGPEGTLVRWRCVDLQSEIEKRYGVVLHERTVGKVLRRLGFRRLSVRPINPETELDVQETFKKNFAAEVAEVLPAHAREKRLEFWFQDEARVGQKGTLTRIWAKRGTRPRMRRDQRHTNAYIFGAVCPARDIGIALVMPESDTYAMNQHLAVISKHVADGTHAIVIVDGAGWHIADALYVPENISLLFLPPYSPELNAQKNIWEYLRQNFLAGRIFGSYDAIVDACCSAWNAMAADVGRITSIATRDWLQWNPS